MPTIEDIEQMIDDTLEDNEEQPIRGVRSIDPDSPRIPISDEPTGLNPAFLNLRMSRPLRDVHDDTVAGPDGSPIMMYESHPAYSRPYEQATNEMKQIVMEFLSITTQNNTADLQSLIEKVAQAGKLQALLANIAYSPPERRWVPGPHGMMTARPGNGPTIFDVDIRLSFTVPQAEQESDDGLE